MATPNRPTLSASTALMIAAARQLARDPASSGLNRNVSKERSIFFDRIVCALAKFARATAPNAQGRIGFNGSETGAGVSLMIHKYGMMQMMRPRKPTGELEGSLASSEGTVAHILLRRTCGIVC